MRERQSLRTRYLPNFVGGGDQGESQMEEEAPSEDIVSPAFEGVPDVADQLSVLEPANTATVEEFFVYGPLGIGSHQPQPQESRLR